jgi:hypothetical protein
MKILLACLMCLVLGASECFAIDGGPTFGGAQVTVTGTYSGVFIPIPTVFDPGPPEIKLTDNSLALFTLIIPNRGLAVGTSAVFRNGFFYTGGIQGSADPDSAKVTGILNAEFDQDRQSGTTTVTEHYLANGQFVNTKITADANLATTARLRGKASLTYALGTNATDTQHGDSGGPIQYKVRGFKQSQASG